MEELIKILEEVHEHGKRTGTFLVTNFPESYAPLTFESFLLDKEVIQRITKLFES